MITKLGAARGGGCGFWGLAGVAGDGKCSARCRPVAGRVPRLGGDLVGPRQQDRPWRALEPGPHARFAAPVDGRADGERVRHTGGHGLGLAIVQAIARAHGATLTPRAQPEGGLDVEVTFPAKPVSAPEPPPGP